MRSYTSILSVTLEKMKQEKRIAILNKEHMGRLLIWIGTALSVLVKYCTQYSSPHTWIVPACRSYLQNSLKKSNF